MIGVHAGAIGAERQLLEAILEQQEVVHEDVWNVATLGQLLCRSTSSNVATSQRRDVSTSRRLNVATSQRRDVSTSRRLNVATSQRRDVSVSAVFSSFKSKQGAELEVSGNVRTRGRKSEQQRHRSGRRARDLYCFFVFDNRTDVLYITY